MNPADLKLILEAVREADVSELSLETPDYKLTVRRGLEAAGTVASAPAPAAVPGAPAGAPVAQEVVAPAPTPAAAPAEAKGVPVKAPIVGTFYRSSAPDAPPYVEVGDRVEPGKVLCIIEAMKLMNEIEAEVSGTVRQVLVGNAEPVEYGQSLFVIEP